jgi:hypothetical protein
VVSAPARACSGGGGGGRRAHTHTQQQTTHNAQRNRKLGEFVIEAVEKGVAHLTPVVAEGGAGTSTEVCASGCVCESER